MSNSIFSENQSKRLTVPFRLLLCFAMFATWQMGVVYFSGQTLSLDGRTPLPVDVGNVTVLIVVGYILSILLMIFRPQLIVWAERVSALAALTSALGLYFPLSPDMLAGLLYIQFFCCIFMIGFENAVIVYLFSEKSAARHLLMAYPIACALVAILQNDFVKVPFSVFRVFMVISLVLMLIFFFWLPGNVWPSFAKKGDGLVCPRRFFKGFYLLVFLGSLLTLFGSTLVETVIHGVFVYYLSMAAYELLVFFLWKRFGVSPMRSVTGLVAVSALGFVSALASLYIPALSLVACVLLAAGMAALCLFPLLGIIAAKQYPSRFISPWIIGLCLIGLLIHSALLEAFRDTPATLYIVYLVISVSVVILYLILEPYLIYSFRKGTSLAVLLSPAEDVPAVRSTAVQVWEPQPDTSCTAEAEAPAPPRETAVSVFDILSGQELRVVELMQRGFSNREMAEVMKISENTVKGYRSTMYSKLQIHSKRELFALVEKEK